MLPAATTSRSTPWLFLGAGYLTWAVTFAAWFAWDRPQGSPGTLAAALLAWGAFGAGFWAATRHGAGRGRLPGLALQGAAIFGLAALGQGGLSGVLLAVLAGQLPMVMGLVPALALLAALTLGFAALLLRRANLGSTAYTAVSYFAFELFAAGAAHFARREADARDELLRVHSELLATRSLLEDSSRMAERLRISRELHDSVGHHLAALSLQLEVARNTGPGNAAVLRAQEVARAMLSEVRAVVGALREPPAFDLRVALRQLASSLPAPEVHLALPERIEPLEAEVAHAVFRCVQEAVTNAVRHAAAENLWISLASRGGALEVEVRDDGRGAEPLAPGHGLVGLRERLAELGGTLELEGRAGQGVRLRARVPLKEAAA